MACEPRDELKPGRIGLQSLPSTIGTFDPSGHCSANTVCAYPNARKIPSQYSSTSNLQGGVPIRVAEDRALQVLGEQPNHSTLKSWNHQPCRPLCIGKQASILHT
eukprot:IDg3857t1